MGKTRTPNAYVARQCQANPALGGAAGGFSLENRPGRWPEEARSGFLFVALQAPPRTARIPARGRNSCAFRIGQVAKAASVYSSKIIVGKDLWRSWRVASGLKKRRAGSLRLRSAAADQMLRSAGSTGSKGPRILLGGPGKGAVDYG